MRPEQKTQRYELLDELRGLDLISMMLYHAMWDLVHLFGVWLDWYIGLPGYIWQQSVCWVFILLSGFCVPFGRHTVRRGAVVFAAGALTTAVTLVFMPQSCIWFGVLTLLGSAMLLTAALKKPFELVPPVAGIVVCFALFLLCRNAVLGYIGVCALRLAVPRQLYVNYFTAYLGFYPAGFYSSDYFPLVPWLFLFWTGCFLHRAIGRQNMGFLRRAVCLPLGWLGRRSLLIYLLHQPVIYGVMLAVRSAAGFAG